MTVTQRRDLSEEDTERLLAAKANAEQAREDYQRLAVELSAQSFNGTLRAAKIPRKSLQDWRAKYGE